MISVRVNGKLVELPRPTPLLDYVVFGHVFPTVTHPEARPVGLEALGEVAGSVKIPVLAIGGVDPELEESCWKVGAAGFAAIAYFQSR